MPEEQILIIGGTEPDLSTLAEGFSPHELFLASSWKEAREALENHSGIQMIVIDMAGCRGDGLDILRNLSNDPRYTDIYTILITSEDEPDVEYLALHTGANDTVHTPLEIDLVRELLLLYQAHELRKSVNWKFREKDLLLNALLWRSPIGIAISHGTNVVGKEMEETFIVNSMFEKITGRTKEEIQELGWVNITHPDDIEEELKNYRKLLSGEVDSYEMEKRYIRPDGSAVWVDVTIASIDLKEPDEIHQVCLIQDISKRKMAEQALTESERSKSLLLTNLPGMAYRCANDADWTFHYASPGCFDLTGYLPEEIEFSRNVSYKAIILPEYLEEVRSELLRAIKEKTSYRVEYEILTKHNGTRWVTEIGQGVGDANGTVEALEGIILDITDRKMVETSLKYHNEHDIWTSLYNHSYFENFLKETLERERTESSALIAVNISSIYTLSRRYGFQYSQETVKRVARSLEELCSDTIQLFRAYENHFAFYVRDYGTKDALFPLLKSLYERLDEVFSIERIGWGIGIVEIDQSVHDGTEQILRNLLIASEKSLDSFYEHFEYCFFNEELSEKIDREEQITRELYEIAAGQNPERLYLQYQAIYNLETCSVVGFEALARLTSERYGNIPPLEFIPIAEKTKLIIPLGEVIFRNACLFLKALSSRNLSGVRISVNISPDQVFSTGFTETILNIIEEIGVSPSGIGLEITESVIASNFSEVNRVLGLFISKGIYVSLDDFGTGYSSLSRERDLNVTCIKIDKSFVDRLITLKAEEAITGDIVSMAHKLGHCVVAEGVEEQVQLDYLKSVGCEMVQGYLISRPLLPEDAVIFLREQTSGGGSFFCTPSSPCAPGKG